MLKIEIPENLKNKINGEILNDITKREFNDKKYEIKYINNTTSNKQFIKVQEENGKINFIFFSREKAKESRNAFIAQLIITSYIEFFNCENINKEFLIYLLDTSEKAKTDYQKFIYRCIKTLNCKIINFDKLDLELTPFTNYEDFKNSRKFMNRDNNNSTFFYEEEEHINFYGKVFGANGKESSFLSFVLNKLTSKKIRFFQVLDNGTQNISKTDKKFLEINNLEFQEELVKEYENSIQNINQSIKDLRNTPKFHYNLFKKYGEKKCYLCECDIERLIVGAHIHRVADIKKDTSLNDNEKGKQIVSENNGFWLCSNHDKLFEYGLIYFENNELKINKTLLEENEISFINKITDNFSITQEHFKEEIIFFLNKHRQRFNI